MCYPFNPVRFPIVGGLNSMELFGFGSVYCQMKLMTTALQVFKVLSGTHTSTWWNGKRMWGRIFFFTFFFLAHLRNLCSYFISWSFWGLETCRYFIESLIHSSFWVCLFFLMGRFCLFVCFKMQKSNTFLFSYLTIFNVEAEHYEASCAQCFPESYCTSCLWSVPHLLSFENSP